jgi:hypothetical protein
MQRLLLATALLLVSSTAHADDLPAAYAALFDAGRSWTFTYTESSGGDTDAHDVTCKVVDVHATDVGILGKIECTPAFSFEEAVLVPGTYLATPKGLFHVDGDATFKLLDAKPKKSKKSWKQDGEAHRLEVRKTRGAWCIEHHIAGVDNTITETVCFDGHGLAGFTASIPSGYDTPDTYVLVPKNPPR